MSATAYSQVLEGTIAIVRFSEDRIVVAVESGLLVQGQTGLSGAAGGNACKVISLGNKGFFLNTGILGVTDNDNKAEPVVWNANEAARQAHRVFGKRSSAQVAHEWGRRSTRILNRMFVRYPDLVIGDQNDKAFGIFGFVEKDNTLSLHWVTIAISSVRPHTASFTVENLKPVLERSIGTPKYIALMDEFVSNSTPRAQRLHLEFQQEGPFLSPSDPVPILYRDAIRAAIRWSPGAKDISEPIDILLLPRGGPIKWVARKAECRRRDYFILSFCNRPDDACPRKAQNWKPFSRKSLGSYLGEPLT